MPSLKCLCGETINLSEVPNENEFPLYSDQQLEQLQDSLVSVLENNLNESQRQSRISAVFSARRPKPELIECSACGRLALFRDMSDQIPLNWYLPEVVPDPTISRIREIFSANKI